MKALVALEQVKEWREADYDRFRSWIAGAPIAF